jgi:hypothetical protein
VAARNDPKRLRRLSSACLSIWMGMNSPSPRNDADRSSRRTCALKESALTPLDLKVPWHQAHDQHGLRLPVRSVLAELTEFGRLAHRP